ncbi:uncharacterized protein EHS24_006000 [Apiotrichum porosum]|uniref:Uncharacterized protein n=1 Tax=Apiotrichum porosum TaxID=105984 RepID=A0A427Y057_9TREE|nr:uncharacterized protein EHS24_006000 [Apiotrichum porosum]RSH84479.1 hypothetical protein EHS24_006000 [Apiotrichum porosum]
MPRSARGRPASSTTARPFSPSPPRDNVHSSSRPPSLLFGAAPTGGLVVSPGLNLAALPPTPTFGSSKGSTIWPSLAHERDPMDDWADNNRGRPQRQSPSGHSTAFSDCLVHELGWIDQILGQFTPHEHRPLQAGVSQQQHGAA